MMTTCTPEGQMVKCCFFTNNKPGNLDSTKKRRDNAKNFKNDALTRTYTTIGKDCNLKLENNRKN